MTKKHFITAVGLIVLAIIVHTVYTQYIYLRYTPVPIVKAESNVEVATIIYRDLLGAFHAERVMLH